MPVDAESMEELRRAEPTAVHRLVTDYQTALYRFFHCRHQNHHAAEELTAETFLQLIRALPSFRGDASQVRAFVFAVARNVLSHWYRRQTNITADIDHESHAAMATAVPVDQLVQSEETAWLLQQVSELDEAPRDIILMRYVEDLTLQEIAHVMQMPLGTVKSHLHRGRRQLRTAAAVKGYAHESR